MRKTKEIWSKRYGTNPKEGIHKFLESRIKGYKRSNMKMYADGFAEYIGKDKDTRTSVIITNNFQKWIEFLKIKKLI